MTDQQPTTELVVRLATPNDISHIEYLDGFSASPTRHIHRDMDKYFGSVDPSTHELTLIFLLEVNGTLAAKAELMIPPHDSKDAIGYIKRVIVHPTYRGKSYARHLLEHIITYARTEQKLTAIDLHVWDQNIPAIRLYESLGFELQHKEIYFRLPL
jgi:ribosomal protein S18 acetylase RimI-like enzyme